MPGLKMNAIVLLMVMAILWAAGQASAALFQGKVDPKKLLVDGNITIIMDAYHEEGLKKLLEISESALEAVDQEKDATEQANAIVTGWLMANCAYASPDATDQDKARCVAVTRDVARRAKWTDEELVVAMEMSVRKFREAFLRSADGEEDDFKKYNADTETLVSGLRGKITGDKSLAQGSDKQPLLFSTKIRESITRSSISRIHPDAYIATGSTGRKKPEDNELGPYGIRTKQDGKVKQTLLRADIHVLESKKCGGREEALQAWVSPDLYPSLKGKSLIIPSENHFRNYFTDIVGEYASGDKSMIHLCLPSGTDDKETWMYAILKVIDLALPWDEQERQFTRRETENDVKNLRSEARNQEKEVQYVEFLKQNSNKIIAIIKQGYLDSYPKKEKYPPIGKALESYFERPTWEFIPKTLLGVWSVVFKGVTTLKNGRKARFTFIFLGGASNITQENLDNHAIPFTIHLSVNDRDASQVELGNILATIFLE